MTYLHPFFLLMGRAAVVWIGAAVLAGLAIFLVGLGQPDEVVTPFVDAVFLAAFGFPAAAGWLAGAIIQEFQHCTCAWPLPGVNRRIAGGFLAAGAAVCVFVAAMAVQSPSGSLGFAAVFALGLAGYCFGGGLFDPLSRWAATFNLIVIVLLVTRSRHLSGLAAEHPVPAVAVSLGLAMFGLARLFSRANLRRRPFRPASPFPGTYSLERSQRYGRQKLVGEGAKKRSWRFGYLGTDIRSWVRAAAHEIYGAVGWKTVWRVLGRLWALGLLFVIYAWSDKGDLGFGESIGKTVYHAFFDPPHIAPFGEHSRSPIVILVIAAAGAALTLKSQAALSTTLTYPLSRQGRAAITHLAGLVDAAVFFVGLFALMSIVGQSAGSLVGYPLRMDFLPCFFHPLAATVILMPLAHWGGLQLRIATWRKTENTLVAAILVVVGFVAVVWIWSALVPGLLTTPTAELVVSALLFCASQIIYRRKLSEYFALADLV